MLTLVIKNITGTVPSEGVIFPNKLTISIDSSATDIQARVEANEKLAGKLGFNVKYTQRITDLKFNTATSEMESIVKEDDKSGPLTFSFSPKLLKFKKQMYAPNEITLDLLVTPGAAKNDPSGAQNIAFLSKETLEAAFSNKQVGLECDGFSVCEDYYVHEIQPRYKAETMYITLKIYSPDKTMTLSQYSRTFVAKKLMREILEAQRGNYNLPYNDKQTPISVNYAGLQNIKKGEQEHIFPYLVQYNESFYDFLARTTNRWGEFLYWEDGKLNIGLGMGTEATKVEKYETITYDDLTSKRPQQNNSGQYTNEAPYDKNIWDNPIKPDSADAVANELGCAWKDGGGDVYLMKKIHGLLGNSKNLWDFTFDTLLADSVTLAQVKLRVEKNNSKFNKKYFNKGKQENGKYKDMSDIPNAVEQWDDKSYNEFSELKPIINEAAYGTILEGEMYAGKNSVTVEFGTAFPGYKLGQVITVKNKNYIVVEVEGYMPERLSIVDNSWLKKEADTTTMLYKVVAVAPCNDKYYPPIIPAGHVRYSGSQIASVEDADDPLKKNRVRVKYTWQDQSEDSSPWIVFGTNAASEKAGIQSKHYKNDRVWVDFVYGNIERPYVVASIPTAPPGPLKINNIVYSTPSGQVIKMTDGVGLGASAMIDNLTPATKLLQGFFPGVDLFGVSTGGNDDKDSPMKSKFFEGGIELCDKYGIWSIKGSTDGRNVTVKSSWGDVKINAFTGINISAPNGDIKISGKNVTIEAGNNLTLTSGKNVKNKFLWDVIDKERGSWANLGLSLAQAVPKAIASYSASLLDISIFRHLIELFVKPVEGKLQISSNRYLMLEAGGGKTAYPVDAYKMNKKVKVDDVKMKDPEVIMQAFEGIPGVVSSMYQEYKRMYERAQQLKAELEQAMTLHKKGEDVPCKKLDDMLSAMWNNDDLNVDEAFMEFKDYLENVTEDTITEEQLIHWMPANRHNFNMIAKLCAVIEMGHARGVIMEKASALASAIKEIKNYSLQEYIVDYTPSEKLQQWLKDELLNPQGLIKKEKNEDFKKLTAPVNIDVMEMKKQCRKFFIELVNKFEFKRSAYLAPGAAGKPTVPAEPNPFDDEIEEKWFLYVNSIRMMPKKINTPSTAEKLVGSMLDPLVSAVKKQFSGLWESTVTDHLAYAPAKRGKILFSASPGTMVLDEDIYRANVDFAEDVNYGVKNGVEEKVDGYATRVRKCMMVQP